MKGAKAAEHARSPCPIANTLDLVGDKWTLLVIRDLAHGKRTFGELLASPEGIPTNLLADRLKRLEAAGLVARNAYHERPPRYAYELTEKGADLRPILAAFVNWGKKHVPKTRTLKEIGTAAQPERAKRRSV